ncbi:MAG: NifB/NifX family molybdenum-iron cluster-binding protein [Halanaerobiales bacterium]|nr:NifB/NifX family molybdenum-iron cluster-binding protein [Halanaerobiales bacterium]
MKKIAVPTNKGKVAQHFGRCPEYTIIEVADCDIQSSNVITNPGHEPGFLPKYLNDLDVDIVLAGGMGRRAYDLFNKNNIEVVTGAKGNVEDNVVAYLNNELDTESSLCDHEGHHGHEHKHH